MTEEKAIGVAPATSQWGYDSDFRRASHTIAGVSVAYGYDDDSLLTQAGAETLTRTPDGGQLSAVSLGAVRVAVGHNEYGELATLAAAANGTALYSEGISYDAAGRISVVEEIVEGTPVQWVYGYDKLGQLTSASKNGAPATTWTWDGNGNRLTENGVVSTFDAQDRLTGKGATTYEWDALGGRRRKTEGTAVTQYTHDGLGALTSVTLPDTTVVTYQYDGLQRRVAKLRNGAVVKRWVYDGQYRVAAEVDGAGAVTSRFIYGSQSHSPDYLMRGGVTYAYVKNHLGSIKLVVDSSTGTVAQRLDYDAWGNVSGDTAPSFQPFAFASGVLDGDTRLVHFGSRDYDASEGVWTSKDPVRLRGGTNLFAYSGGRPTQALDPSGTFIEFRDMDRFSILEAQLQLTEIIMKGKKSSEGVRRLLHDKYRGVVLTRKRDDWTVGEGGLTSPRSTTDGRTMCEVQYSPAGHLKALADKGIDTSKYGHTSLSLLGHELGHGYSKLYGDDDSQDAIDWENELLPGRWHRPDHHTPYPGGE